MSDKNQLSKTEILPHYNIVLYKWWIKYPKQNWLEAHIIGSVCFTNEIKKKKVNLIPAITTGIEKKAPVTASADMTEPKRPCCHSEQLDCCLGVVASHSQQIK